MSQEIIRPQAVRPPPPEIVTTCDGCRMEHRKECKDHSTLLGEGGLHPPPKWLAVNMVIADEFFEVHVCPDCLNRPTESRFLKIYRKTETKL